MVNFVTPLLTPSLYNASLPDLLIGCQQLNSVGACELLCSQGRIVENGYCGAQNYQLVADDPTFFYTNCMVGEKCTRPRQYTTYLDSNLIIKTIRGGSYFDEDFDGLPDDVQKKIGDGDRKKFLDVARFAGWACQGWGQLTDSTNNLVFEKARGYAYDGERGVCYLLNQRVQGGGKLKGLEDGKLLSKSQMKRLHRDGFFGTRNSGCDNDMSKCHSLEQVQQMPAKISKCLDKDTFKWEECMNIDSLTAHADPIYCVSQGKTHFDRKSCGVMKELAPAFERVDHSIIIPKKHVAVESSIEDLRAFLVEQGKDFAEFAGKVGFEEPQGPFGVRSQLMSMGRGGAMACRALLRLKGVTGQMIKDVDAFFFDSENNKCYLFKESDFHAENERRVIEVGPIFA